MTCLLFLTMKMQTVLLVDDFPDIVILLQELLRIHFADTNITLKVLTANDGIEAVSVLKLHPVDLVLTDIRMPHMDGIKLLAYCRGNYPSIKVALWSSHIDAAWHSHLGADLLMQKGMDPQVMLNAVRELLLS